MRKTSLVQVEPDQDSTLADLLPAHDNEPNTALAIVLLASGQSLPFIRQQCGFENLRELQQFAKDDDVRAAVKDQRAQRVQRVSDLALVSLEKLVTREHTDLRAQVLAIRTALEVGGDLYNKDSAARVPIKNVADLSVSELNELIASTKRELSERLGEYRPDGQTLPTKQ